MKIDVTHSTFFRRGTVVLAGLLLAACGDDDDTPSTDTGADVADTSMMDTGTTDTSMPDTSMPDVDEDTATSPGTIPEVASAAGSFDTLVQAVIDVGLDDDLSGDGPFTVFAPTDDAFGDLPDGTLASLSTDALTDILLYHVYAGELPSSSLSTTTITMLNGAMLDVTVGDDVMVGAATVTAPDIEASNGLIHVIDTVLLPPQPDVVDIALSDDRFTTLVDALGTAELVTALQGEGPFTVFAPTNAAFDALPEGTLESLTVEQLTEILLFHVVPDDLVASDVLGTTLLQSLSGAFITVDADAGTVAGAPISGTDNMASNGVVHVIDQVMLPPGDIPTVATEAGSFTTLVQAVVDVALDDDLSAEGPFTVFAPTDDAFDALPDGTLASLSDAQLADILLYHVYDGALLATDVVAATELTMLNGDVAVVAVAEGSASIDGAPISATDIAASNGIIHVLDAVMLPPAD